MWPVGGRFVKCDIMFCVVLQWFRDEVSQEDSLPDELLSFLFSHLDPIYEVHCRLLKEIERRMAAW